MLSKKSENYLKIKLIDFKLNNKNNKEDKNVTTDLSIPF